MTPPTRTAPPSEPLDILHTESSLGWGGQEIRILTEAQGMIRRGHRVRLLCPGQARIYAEAARYGVAAEALPIGRKNLKGFSALTGWFRRHARADLPAVINTHSSTDSWLAALAMVALGKPAPIVRTRHISAKVPPNLPTRWLYRRAASRIVTTGEALRQQLLADLDIPSGQIQSIPTGIDTQIFLPGDRQAARAQLGLPAAMTLVGIVATLRSWKGHRYLVEACVGLSPTIGLVIVGDGPQHEALKRQVEECGLSGRVWMPGNQPDVVPWLRAFDLFALPSYANEGVPQALVQAMLVGLPCVTTMTGSIGELARHQETALIVPAEDPAALREAIELLAADAPLRARLGAAARAFCLERYSLEHMLDHMESTFRSVVRDVSSFPRNPRAF
jgi:glycosyltransferase involved in cell wall biosynthesis